LDFIPIAIGTGFFRLPITIGTGFFFMNRSANINIPPPPENGILEELP
jgi:hypothetical protein